MVHSPSDEGFFDFSSKGDSARSRKKRSAIFEMIVWKVPKTKDYPEGLKYRAWLSENGVSIFGFDNHKPKGPHLHIGNRELGYVFRGYDELMKDIRKMIEEEGLIYEE